MEDDGLKLKFVGNEGFRVGEEIGEKNHFETEARSMTTNFNEQKCCPLSATKNLRGASCEMVMHLHESKTFSGKTDTEFNYPSPVNSKSNYSAFHSDFMHNWQASKHTIRERFAFLLNNEILSDVHFIVGKYPAKRIPAHKFILSCGSAVFDAMFNGPLNTSVNEIELPDVEAPALLALLSYLYSDKAQINSETVITTLYAAKKYAVPGLENHCTEFLQSILSIENAFTVLTQARLFDKPELATLCLETIDSDPAKGFASDDFIDVDLDTLCTVLERDTLRICETEIFKAVLKWGKAECVRQNLSSESPGNLRTAIGKALKLVRFPLMPIKEFASYAAQSGILTDKEALELFLYYTVNPKPKISFSALPRSYFKVPKKIIASRFPVYDPHWGYAGNSDRVGLVVDRKIFIMGFGLYGSPIPQSEYNVLMQLIHAASGKVCGSNTTCFTSDVRVPIFRILFEEPIEVLPHTNYIASVKLRGPDSYFGRNGRKKIQVNIPEETNGKVTFEFHDAGINNGTSIVEGQIPEIIFHV